MHTIRFLFIVGFVFLAPTVLLGQIYHPDTPMEARTDEETHAWLTERLPLPPGWAYQMEHQEQG